MNGCYTSGVGTIGVWVLFFWGTPDLMDVTIAYIQAVTPQ